jgi:hypothetical protein
MDKFWRIIAVVVLVFVLIGFYWTRNQVVAVNYPYAPAFYKVNRLSGDITLVVGKEFVQVKEVDEKLTRPEGPPAAPAPEQAPSKPAPAPAPAPTPKK